MALAQSNAKHRLDLPIPCDCAIDLPMPGGGDGCSNAAPCEACWDWSSMKRRTRRLLILAATVIALTLAYFYGSQITKIEISQVDVTQRNDGPIQKLLSRSQPSLRALIIVDGKKIYSETKLGEKLTSGATIALNFKRSFSPRNVSKLEIHDARFSAAGELIVLGQVLESVEQPSSSGQGKRFSYKFKSRWGF